MKYTIKCADCGHLATVGRKETKRCYSCAWIHNRNQQQAKRGKFSQQLTFESMNDCQQCGLKFGAFSKHEKYCPNCKVERNLASKARARLGLTFHEFKDEPEYSAHRELVRDANYRVDNDPNCIFNGSHFRKIDIVGGVQDGWLVGADVTHVVTGITKKAEEW